MSSPTQRTLADCRRLGYQAAITERWNPYARIRQDLFQFCDVLALGDGVTYAIQTTSTSGAAARKAKIEGLPTLAAVLDAGWLVEVWSYRKVNGRKAGKRKLWSLRRERLAGPGTWVEIQESPSTETCEVAG